MAENHELMICGSVGVHRKATPGTPSQCYVLLKRTLDLFVSTVLLIALAPVWLAIAIAIKLDSRGPVLFTQIAVGQHGAEFRLLKFRTMVPGSQRADHKADIVRNMCDNTPTAYDAQGRPIYKTALVDQSRITRVGHVLRRTSLDELPQLWSVFVGKMSLVGPRPSLPWEADHYTLEQRHRFDAKPGMTGLYQVMARNRVSIAEMIRIDLDYVGQRSMWLDIKLLAKNAYRDVHRIVVPRSRSLMRLPPRPRSADVVRVGVIGVGYWGPNLVRTLNEIDGAELVRVADVRPGRREFVQKRFPGVQTTADIGDIVSDASIDAVFIATPPETHHAIASQALNAGKHVFVEKPLTTRSSDAEQLVSLACQLGRKLAVGHLFLYHPAVVLIRELLDQGALGDVYFISSTRANLGPPNTRIDVLWDLAPHDISIVLRLMDESPVEVVARGAWFTKEGFVETAYINMAFASGRMAQVNVSWLTPSKTRLLQMVCSKRTIVYDDMQPVQKVQVFDAGEDNRLGAPDNASIALTYGAGSIWSPPVRNMEPLRLECEDFIRSIATDAEPVSNGRRALEVVRVLEAASESMRRPSIRAAVALGSR